MLENLLSLLLLLHCTAVTVSQNCTQEGAVEIIGTVTPTLIAGRMEICVDGLWRAVYDDKWGTKDVELLCNENGFPTQGASFCIKSCFGSSNRSYGMAGYVCQEAETFMGCESVFVNQKLKLNNSGIICIRNVTTPTPPYECEPCTTASPHPDHASLPTASRPLSCDCSNCSQDTPTTTDFNTGFTAMTVLGLALLLTLLILMGVVMGWVWSCQRRKSPLKTSALDNPVYNPISDNLTTPTSFPSQYSTVGPGDTPTTRCPPEGEYQVVGHEETAQYEVVGTKETALYDVQKTSVDYNTLQHN